MFNQLFFLLLIIPVLTSAQDCDLKLIGSVKDSETGIAVPYTNIVCNELQKGAIGDSSGAFQYSDLCEGKIVLEVSCIGYRTDTSVFFISQDTSMTIYLEAYPYTIKGIVVSEEKTETSTQSSSSLNKEHIATNSDKNLSNLLEQVVGLSVLKNGNGISKPVVQGLYGSRLMVLNNGVVQAGQQWGNDHSPEIDPFVANQISVIKGAAALEYQGSSLGAFILVEPGKISKNKKLNGTANYYFSSNGFGHGINVQLGMNHKLFSWKLSGTLKKKGDAYSPAYFLRNTGNQEANFALQIEKNFSDKWFTSLYFSSFNTEIGILRGSHIGNLTDLQSALRQEVPFFTQAYFSYALDAPFQQVNHQLLKLNARYYINSNQYLDFTYSGQLNDRKEFDVRRSNYAQKPALSLMQFSNSIEAKYLNYFNTNLRLKVGIQSRIIDNTNHPGTGILPLVPDYFAYNVGAFFLITQKYKKIFWEAGARYDFMHQAVAAISTSLPREIVRYKNNFHNISALLGLNYQPNKALKLYTNVGSATRNPSINELYSNGLHQGVSAIEEGDAALKVEQAIKTTLGLDLKIKERLFLETALYYQWINNFIYQQVQNEFRLTIRGAFPVYRYEQTLAQIYGLDVSVRYKVLENLNLKIQYSYLRGEDLEHQLPLVNMPANNLRGRVSYTFPKVGSLENLMLELNNRYVFEQSNLLPSQDFILAPKAYHLLGLRASVVTKIKHLQLKIYLRVDNLLNTKYRDYLNKQRYFSDDLGINGTLGLMLNF